ncbi:tetratricopeptide repeat protein 16-like isoform X2 [Parambassis ranga]|uniref:Tetratricopeptide repeat protein 16-like isoform X2 n=1 Tax=Parambassis ranga TaxID=210632 RepID=A0A6P7IZJ9_9TELE|nr:tetratricopeptide repeat protein 16 isoform X2 [Parambassis ranga]
MEAAEQTPLQEELDGAGSRGRSDFQQPPGSSEACSDRPDLQGGLILQSKAAEHHTNGSEAMGQRQYERAVLCFSRAITLQPDQTRLHVSRAEAYLQLCDFQSAAACYQRALALEPGELSARLAFVYYLQGQCLFDGGLSTEALEAFSKAAEIKPGCRSYEVRSLACLSAVGQHADCLKMVNAWMASDGPTADLYILRARLHKQLDQPSRCYHDVKSALALRPTCPQAGTLLLQLQEAGEQARQAAVDRALTGRLHQALFMMNVAVENSPQDGRLYLFRGILYRRLKDFTNAIGDLVQAAELSEEEEEEVKKKKVRGQAEAEEEKNKRDSVGEEAQFQLVLTYNDFAVQCFSRGLYREAALLLSKAIEEEKGQAGLYLNRGDCFFKQADWHYALADYQQAEEMLPPDDPAVRLRLAVVHNTLGSVCFQDGRFQEAADMFSFAIHYNPAVSQYYENRTKTFRKLLNISGARQDFICMLILDPSNQEVPPLLMHLFPGFSVSDVLSSPTGAAIRAELVGTIQACSSSSDPQSLSEKLQKTTLTNESTESQSEAAAQPGRELGLCLNQDDALTTAKLLQAAVHTPHPTPPSSPRRGGGARDSSCVESTSKK